MAYTYYPSDNPLTYLILKHRGRSKAVFRNECFPHEGLLAEAQRSFPSLQHVPASDIVLVAPIPGYPDPEPVEISPRIWASIFRTVHAVTITRESEMPSASGDTTACGSPVPSVTDLPEPPGPPPSSSSSRPHPTPRRVMSLKVAKPVIYLYPPSNLEDVTVELALTSSWRFSAVHPPPQTTIPPGEPHTAQSLTWKVTAEPNGTLVDKTSGMEVSYLYWEAKMNANSQLITPGASRATTPVENTETFDPAHPFVDPGDSVLLPISKVPSYLDAALKSLVLHTEARTSFITYWLPDMLKHDYIALRFIAQDVYERAASLRIAPAPDIVTRVFMLFRGVAVRDLELWEAASMRAAGTGADGPTFWADVVGVDASRAADSRLFRVLEWGGMEVK